MVKKLGVHELLNHSATREQFRDLLIAMGMPQAAFARIGGFSVSTVNRWCSSGRLDCLDVPRHAFVMALMLSLLKPEQRAEFLQRHCDA